MDDGKTSKSLVSWFGWGRLVVFLVLFLGAFEKTTICSLSKVSLGVLMKSSRFLLVGQDSMFQLQSFPCKKKTKYCR